MSPNLIWNILGIISIILLIVFFQSRNAVWGGLTIAFFAWLITALFKHNLFGWHYFSKFAIVGILVGFGAELLPKLSSRF